MAGFTWEIPVDFNRGLAVSSRQCHLLPDQSSFEAALFNIPIQKVRVFRRSKAPLFHVHPPSPLKERDTNGESKRGGASLI